MSTQYIRYPAASSGGGGGVLTYANLASFPSGPSDGQLGIALDSHLLYEYNLGLLTWQVIGGANLVLSIGTVDSQTPSADGAVIASNALVMQSASATVPGLMSTAAQSFAGTKTFNASIMANGGVDASGTLTLGSAATTINIGNAGSVVNIQGTTIYENTPILQVVDPKITLNKGGAAGSGQNSGFEIEEAGSITGYLETSASRNDFSMKAPATAGVITFTPGISGFTIDQGSHNPVTIGTANGLSLSTQVLSLDAASASVPGAVTTGAQTFAGAKTFSSAPILSSLSASLPLKLDASKNVTAAAIDLSGSEVTSTLAIGNGGTGATTQQTAINALTGTQTNAYYLRSNGTNASLSALAAADLSGTVAITNGGTGATTQQAAINALTGTQTNAYYLRSNGTNASLSALEAADLSGTVAITNGGTGQSTASAGFDALSPNTTKGDITVRSSTSNTRLAVGSDGQVLVADSSQTLGVKWATAAQGAKNYITYNNFENNATTGWSLSHTTLSSSIPNQASGSWTSASGNLSMSVVSSGQLAGSYSLSLASSAATTAGDMLVSQAYTIDIEDQAKPLTFKFYYSATSNSSNLNFSGTSSNTYQIYIYDVANSAWIQPAGVYGMTQGSGVGYVTGTFQTPSNMTSFRIAIVCINASAGANTIYFDDFFLGPQTAPLGAAVSDWKTYTTVITHVSGSATNLSTFAMYRRVGSDLEAVITGGFTGAAGTWSSLYLSIPSGLTIDISTATGGDSTNYAERQVGEATITDVGFKQYDGFVVLASTTTVQLLAYDTSSTYATPAPISNTVPFSFGNTDIFQIKFKVPISGWSSNVQMSNDTDTRVVALSAVKNTGSAANNENPVTNWTTVIKDSHGAFNATTGIYTVPISGFYSITGNVAFASNATGVRYARIAQNGSISQNFGGVFVTNNGAGNATWVSSAAITYCVAGDTLVLNGFQNSGGSLAFDGTNGATSLSIQRLSGPSVIAATESVNAKATTSSTAIASVATTTIVFSASVFDSHGCYSTSTGKYTIPVSGKYRISGAVYSSNSGTNAVSAEFRLIANQSGSASNTSTVGRLSAQTTSIIGVAMNGSTIFNCLAGDQIWFTVFNGGSSTITLNNAAADNFICIERIGN